jgi:hypothetical protein
LGPQRSSPAADARPSDPASALGLSPAAPPLS